MNLKNKITFTKALAIAGILSFAAVPAYAGNGNEAPVSGNSADAVVKVSAATDVFSEEIALGYVVGSNGLTNRKIRDRFYRHPGELFLHDGKNYRRVKIVKDDKIGYVSFPIGDKDPFYKRDGSARIQPLRLNHFNMSGNVEFLAAGNVF